VLKQNKKNTCIMIMILNDKPNGQVSRILKNLRPIYVKRSENDSLATLKDITGENKLSNKTF
jgi:hypothetical protein